MRLDRTRRRAVVVGFVLVVGCDPPEAWQEPAEQALVGGNEVTRWNEIMVTTLSAFPGPAGGAPPAVQGLYAQVHGAVHDAVNAIEPTYEPYLLETQFDPAASKEAAVATAAYLVLLELIDDAPSSVPKASLVLTLNSEYTSSLAAIPDGPAEAEGIAAGEAAAAAMNAARENDGRYGPSAWVPSTEIGHWWPQLSPTGQPLLDPTPWAGNVTPFLLESSSQFRTDGPNALTGAAYAEDFNEVKVLGAFGNTTRTPEQLQMALFWTPPPPVLWNRVARSLVQDPQYGIDLDASALLFAMLNLAAADSAINCWNDKYYWDFWRPWQAIHEAGDDGNPATEPDPSWTAERTAPYPEHPSGHLALDSAYVHALQMFFGTDKIPFEVVGLNGATREYPRFSVALRELIDSRVYLGLHFRTADVQSVVLGKKVVHVMARHYFQPL